MTNVPVAELLVKLLVISTLRIKQLSRSTTYNIVPSTRHIVGLFNAVADDTVVALTNVEIIPVFTFNLRIRFRLVSTIYNKPVVVPQTPFGVIKIAEVACPPSPIAVVEVVDEIVPPAIVLIVPLLSI